MVKRKEEMKNRKLCSLHEEKKTFVNVDYEITSFHFNFHNFRKNSHSNIRVNYDS